MFVLDTCWRGYEMMDVLIIATFFHNPLVLQSTVKLNIMMAIDHSFHKPVLCTVYFTANKILFIEKQCVYTSLLLITV